MIYYLVQEKRTLKNFVLRQNGKVLEYLGRREASWVYIADTYFEIEGVSRFYENYGANYIEQQLDSYDWTLIFQGNEEEYNRFIPKYIMATELVK